MFGQSKPQIGSGLSINTSSANSQSTPSQILHTGSLFSSQPHQNNSIFGSSGLNQGAGLFGLQNNNAPQEQSGSIFGGQSTQPQAASIFAPESSQQQSRGLFGGIPTQKPQSQIGGLIPSFGQNQTQAQAQNQTQLGGLFGASDRNKSTSMFQNPNIQSQLQNQPNQLQFGISTFSTSIGQFTQQQQSVPGVRISINELRSTTRFNDLHEDLQKTIEKIDDFILGQIKLQEECEGFMSEVHGLSNSIPNDVEYCTKTLETMQIALENDAEAIAYAKTLVKADSTNAKLSFKVIQNLKMPQQFQHFALWNMHSLPQAVVPSSFDEGEVGSNENLVAYFSKEADEMSKLLLKYKGNVTEVETYLKGLEFNIGQRTQQIAFLPRRDGSGKGAEAQVRELAAVLREFENGILGVASKVGAAREKVQEVILGGLGDRQRARQL